MFYRWLILVCLTLTACRTTNDHVLNIFGGEPISESDSRAQGVVMLKTPRVSGDPPFGTCTGTFVTQTQVLTAGHCLGNGESGNLVLGSGRSEYRSQGVDHQGRVGLVPPREWFADRPYTDLVIAHFPHGSAPEGVTVPICASAPRPGDAVYQVGYGRTEFLDVDSSGEKHLVESRVVSIDPDLGTILVARQGTGGLPGDSGGPLLSIAENCTFGVFSFLMFDNDDEIQSTYVNLTDGPGADFLRQHGLRAGVDHTDSDSDEPSGEDTDQALDSLVGLICVPEESYRPTLNFRHSDRIRILGVPPGTDGFADVAYHREQGRIKFKIPYSPEDINQGDDVEARFSGGRNRLQSTTGEYVWNCTPSSDPA